MELTGRAVQGSILGVMDHNTTLEEVDEEVNIKAEKYVDDMMLFHSIKRDTQQ